MAADSHTARRRRSRKIRVSLKPISAVPGRTRVLKLDGVVAAYDDVICLHGVSLEVRRGEIVTLIGANGAGKSTTLKTISGLLTPRAGTVEFDGQTIAGRSPDAIVALGLVQVPEGRRVFPELTVEENLRVGAYLVDQRTKVRGTLSEVYDRFPRLAERRKQLAGTLSGGEQQMLAFGRAMMAQPKLLMLDEPSLGLAPRMVDEVMRSIRLFRESGVTIFLVEQNANLALRLADRAYVMEPGQSIRESVEMVANLKNSAGGVLGRQVEIVIGDDAGKPEEAAVVARRFATRDQVSLAIGSVSSPASLAAAQVFREEELPQIVVSGTAQRITTQGNEWVFRSAVPDRKLVGDMVDFINERMPKLKRFGFVYVNDDFGKGGFDAFTEAGKKFGMSVTAEERYSRGDLDFIGQLTRIRSTNPDAIVEWSRYTEGALIHRQIKQMGWELPRFGSDGIAAPAFLDLAKEAANGVIYPTHFSPATSTKLPAAQA